MSSEIVSADNGRQMSSSDAGCAGVPAALLSAPEGLIAVGGRNEVHLNWSAVEFASSYNVFRDGAFVGTTTGTSYTDPEGEGFGLGYSEEYCYTITTTNASGAETLPYVLAGLNVSVDPVNKLIYVGMINFWPISGYQFDVSMDDSFTILGVDAANSLLDAQYLNGRVIGFSLSGDLIPAGGPDYNGNGVGDGLEDQNGDGMPDGTLLSVLAYAPNGNNFSGTFGVSLSDFTFADESYLGLNVCDMDFNPLNGCDVSTTFDYSIDCNGDDDGVAFLDSCGVCSHGNTDHVANSDIDCHGDCFGEAFLDTCGVCSEGNSGHVADSNIDCNDECFGDALVDECGECQVSYCYDYVTHQVNFDFPCDGPTEMYVVPDNPQNPYWNGSMDECGVCFGDDLSCATVDVSYGVINNGSFIDGSLGVIEVLYNSTVDVHGFQFNLDGVSLTGGSSDIGNLSASSNTGNVIGFSLSGDVLPEGEGVLALLYFDPSYDGTDMCMTSEIISAYGGNQIESTNAGCTYVIPGEGAFPGDANLDGATNILDAVMVVEFIFGTLGIPMTDIGFINADLSTDGILDILDLVSMVDIILETPARLQDATVASVVVTDNEVTLSSDGYVGAVQLTLTHDVDIEVELSESAFISGHHTEGNTTQIIVLDPTSELFTVSGDFEIEEVVAASGDGYIDVNVYDAMTYSISSIYPNPFNPETTIEYSIPTDEMVSVSIYDLQGRMVTQLTDGVQSAGYHRLTWNASEMPTGLYFVRMVAGSYRETQKIMLIK